LKIKAFEEDQPLSLLDGLTIYQEDRLLLEGIENLQNLASANIVELMLKTRFSVEQIVDWIDQALLHMHTGEYAAAFRNSSMRTATDFLDVYRKTPEARRPALAELLVSQLPKDDKRPVTLTATTALAPVRFTGRCAGDRSEHLTFTSGHAFETLPDDVEHAHPAICSRCRLPIGAIETYDNLLRDFPNYPSALYQHPHFWQGLQRAITDYTDAIQRGGRNDQCALRLRGARARAARSKTTIRLPELSEALDAYPDFGKRNWVGLRRVRASICTKWPSESGRRHRRQIQGGRCARAAGTARYGGGRRSTGQPLIRSPIRPSRAMICNERRRKPKLIHLHQSRASPKVWARRTKRADTGAGSIQRHRADSEYGFTDRGYLQLRAAARQAWKTSCRDQIFPAEAPLCFWALPTLSSKTGRRR
jgi:hypothetical protein